MKQAVATGINEFSSERIMASTCKIVVVSAILLACLSLSLAIVKESIDVSKNFVKYNNYDIHHFPREKREDTEYLSKEIDNPIKIDDKLLESPTIYDERISEETIDQRTETREPRKDKDPEQQDEFYVNDDTKNEAEVTIKLYH